MTATEAMGQVSDTLVEGMMVHSDHADLMGLIGLGGFAKLHESGYKHDSRAHRKVRRLCASVTGCVCTQGKLEYSNPFSQALSRRGQDISAQDRRQLVKSSLEGWHAWESTASSRYAVVADELRSLGEATLLREVLSLQRGAEAEMSEALDLLTELTVCNWDLAHAYDMQQRYEGRHHA